MSVQPLFTPVRMGDLHLRNRIVMAPLTRMRARPIDHVPTALQAEYYAQRASAGLIVAEATAISPDGFGWADTPGLWSAWFGRLTVDRPGCYALQVDGTSFTSVIVFAVLPGPLPGG